MSQLLFGPATSFGNALDPCHPPSQHSCGFPESPIIWDTLAFLFELQVLSPVSKLGIFKVSVNPMASSLSLFCHYPLASCYVAILQDRLPPSRPHCLPSAPRVSGGLFINRRATEASKLSWKSSQAQKTPKPDWVYFMVIPDILLNAMEI